MSKKPTKDLLTTAIIAEQTAAFLKSGGVIQQIVKGSSAHTQPAGSKEENQKSS